VSLLVVRSLYFTFFFARVFLIRHNSDVRKHESFEVAGEEYGRRLDEKIGLFEQE